jgi:HEAT repeat protein
MLSLSLFLGCWSTYHIDDHLPNIRTIERILEGSDVASSGGATYLTGFKGRLYPSYKTYLTLQSGNPVVKGGIIYIICNTDIDSTQFRQAAIDLLKDNEMMASAARLLAKSGKKDDIVFLIPLLSASSIVDRMSALKAILKLGGKDAIAPLEIWLIATKDIKYQDKVQRMHDYFRNEVALAIKNVK